MTLVVGADDDFEELPVGIDLFRFREEGVWGPTPAAAPEPCEYVR